ncbi:hypothetical protein N6H05_09570 [Sphingobium sp. WTD-1]|uniref:hypothetical protein n=1 Tax=Sphingobium sp. WTD-1 TaxID=2979467 RepID=UPI0024DEDC50|nr:hypothetical protein [Sphingobium sp. WTD-1]WIA58018.1 hypothetical protein N6H05_09570 [Sphingobium sp. WTD-1]
MTDWPLTVALVLVFAAGICGGVTFASIIYARRYRALRLEIWGERMADEVDAQPSSFLSDADEAALRERLVPIDAIDRAPITIREQMLAMGVIDEAGRWRP